MELLPNFEFNFGDRPVDEQAFALFARELDSEAQEAMNHNRSVREGQEARLQQDYGEGLDRLELLHAAALEASDWGRALKLRVPPDQGPQWDLYFDVQHGLYARLLRTFAEVVCLLRGGYPHGAIARVRTMQEIAATMRVMSVHGQPTGDHPELPARYRDHIGISAGGFFRRHPKDHPNAAVLEQYREAMLERYGEDFLKPNGWAAPLFEGSRRLGPTSIVDLAAAEQSPQVAAMLYAFGSREVHAGSDGWHEVFVDFRGGTTMLAGGTNVGLVAPAESAAWLLLDSLTAVVPSLYIAEDGRQVRDGDLQIWWLRSLATEAISQLQRGEQAVAAREAALADDTGSSEGRDSSI